MTIPETAGAEMDPHPPYGSEIAAKIATRVMGWHWRDAPNDPYCPYAGWFLGDEPQWTTFRGNPWAPELHIEHAFQVVDRMDALGYDLSLFKQRSCEHSDTGEWVGPYGAYFCMRPAAMGDDGNCGHGTAPLAICLAALRAVGS